MPETWIVDCVRSPRGRGKKETGALREIHPQELFAQALNALVARNGFDPRDVEDVVVGTVTEVGDQGGCIARMSVLAAGWPVEATGVSLNRFCGSGQQAVNFAAMGVMSGQQELVIGGGVESMSRVPMGADQSGLDGHNRHLRELHPLFRRASPRTSSPRSNDSHAKPAIASRSSPNSVARRLPKTGSSRRAWCP
jgi:acetyl-CoA C-acetyltransferase